MKKILPAITLLVFSLPAISANDERNTVCTDIAVRFTAFSMIARIADTKEQYEGKMYKMLLEGNADKDNQQFLLKLIEMAWNTRTTDVRTAAMTVYKACIGTEST